MANTKAYAIIAGVGPGTGAAIAKKFAKAYSVVLLARSTSSYASLAKEINEGGGNAIGVSTDVSSAESIKNVLKEIDEKFGKEATCAAAIFNAAGKLVIKPFLEQTEESFLAPFDVNCNLPRLLATASQSPKPTYPPTLIFTGATASLKSSANFSSFAVSKFATRALAHSLTREFGPKGVHVAHAIIDGIIDTPGTAGFMADAGPDAKIDPETVSCPTA
ncbi:hypothetical protein LTR84_003491 [Exophiala bonariae]|uniref:NAD(P)-binding protein n=1 Tax=Exophiala bonariae TaxID=1690606 RepID=A0AAV9N7B6_9EURO|nr:hypothetical protein LTR84_003491 [Exophiala bonariae]